MTNNKCRKIRNKKTDSKYERTENQTQIIKNKGQNDNKWQKADILNQLTNTKCHITSKKGETLQNKEQIPSNRTKQRIKYDKRKQNTARHTRPKQNKTKQNKTRQNKSKQNKTKQNNIKQNKTK